MLNSDLVQRLMRRLMVGRRRSRLARRDPACIGKHMTSEWNRIDRAPKDIWIKVRGWDFGLEGSARHYAIARFENGKWVAVCGDELHYLTDWQALTHRRYVDDRR